MDLAASTFRVARDGHTVVLAAAPTWAAMAGAAVCAGLILACVVRTSRKHPVAGNTEGPRLGALAAGVAFVWALRLWAGGHGGWTVFEAFDASGWAATSAAALGFVGLLMAWVENRFRLRSARDAAQVSSAESPSVATPARGDLAALLVGALAVGGGGLAMTDWLVGDGPLPDMRADSCDWVHQGRSCSPVLVVRRLGVRVPKGLMGLIDRSRPKVRRLYAEGAIATSFDSLGGWTIPAAPIPSTTLGPQSVDVVAHRPGVTVSTTLDGFVVVEDLGVDWLPLAHGNRWTYSDGRSILVGEPALDDGLRVWPVTAEHAGRIYERFLLTQIDGQLRRADGDGDWGSAIGIGAPPARATLAAHGVPAEALRRCSVSWLPGDCVCAEAGVTASHELAGPLYCSATRLPARNLFLSAVAFVGSVTLLKLDPRETTSLHLVESFTEAPGERTAPR